MKKIKALLYCTKGKPYLYKTEDTTYPAYPIGYHTDRDLKLKLFNTNELAYLNGTILCECEIEVEELLANNYIYNVYWEYETFNVKQKELLVKSCLDYEQLLNYLRGYNGYALHISNLKVFDKPRELNNYYTLCNGENESKCRKCFYHYITSNEGVGLEEECLCDNKPALLKAPQNMMNVYDRLGNHYVLISIQPQWLCKILNGEKDIEIRKQVLNCMKN